MDSTVETSVVKEKLASLYAYMSRRLKIQQAPKLVLTKNVENANKPFGFTGHYDYKSKSIKVYITNRHATDILRSFAHEVIHHWQNERGKLTDNGGDGHYAQQNRNMRIREMEAYLLGNIIFRDWQDTQRYGTPEKEPFLVSLNENADVSSSLPFRNIVKEMIRQKIANKIIIS